MKKLLVLILSLFLLTTVNCVTTKQDVAETAEPAKEAEEAVETGPVDYDLSGTWMYTEKITAPDCGGNKTNESTVEITQKGNSVKAVNKDIKGWKWAGKASNNTISIPTKVSGKVKISGYKLMVSGDANTLTSKIDWDYDNGTCDGISNVTYKRK